jgi:carboxylesterase
MNIDDFCYMWRGKIQRPLTYQDTALLAPIDIRHHRSERALLLLHGFSSSPAVYRKCMPHFLRLYDAIVCPTLPGHGDNIQAFTSAKAHDWLLTAEQRCENILQEYPCVDVLGLSLGGLLACHLSQRFNLNHLYLLAPALALHVNLTAALHATKALHWLGLKRIPNKAGNLHMPEQAELAYRQLPLTAIIEILTLIRSFSFLPPRCPTDVFLGRFDAVVDNNVVSKHFAQLTNTTVHWLEQSAHVLPLDGDRDVILDCMQSHHDPS